MMSMMPMVWIAMERSKKAVDWSDACGWEGAMDDQTHLKHEGWESEVGMRRSKKEVPSLSRMAAAFVLSCQVTVCCRR
jgi:hypothetical protein